MSRPFGDASGPLATLPRYQPNSAEAPERTEESVWQLLGDGWGEGAAPPEREPGPRTPPPREGPDEEPIPGGRVTRDVGLDPGAVAAFLLHVLPPGRSLFRGVRRTVEPLPRLRREPAPSPTDEDRLAEALLSAWSDTVREHVASGARDVSLSGGVDSAALCAMAARHAPGRARAWTMDVHFADAVERRNARTVAKACGVELVDLPVPDAALPDQLEPAVLSNETAITNGRGVASFVFYAEARRFGVSELMSGAGADEVLLGNPEALSGARARVAEDQRLAREVLRDAVDNLGKTAAPSLSEARPGPPRPPPGERAFPPPWDLLPEGDGSTEELRYSAWVLRELILPPELRGARKHSITVRTPYLDSRFANVALTLPESTLVRGGTGKWLFRQAVRALVPDEVRFARKTPRYAHIALSSPVRHRWLELYRAWLTPSRLEPLEVIDPHAALGLLERYTRLSPDAPEAGGMDRLLMRLVSLAILHSHSRTPAPCPES